MLFINIQDIWNLNQANILIQNILLWNKVFAINVANKRNEIHTLTIKRFI